MLAPRERPPPPQSIATRPTRAWCDSGATPGVSTVTGQLQLTTTLDHETKESYALTVKVSDGEYTDTASLTVVVLDVNEHPTLSTTPATVNENTASDIKVATVTVTDQDAGDSVRSFSITAGNEGDAFKIDANGNVLTKTRAALNWELLPSFTLTVVATDSGGLSGSAELSITVIDRPEPPTLTPLTASVDENSVAGVTVAATAHPGAASTARHAPLPLGE